VGFKGRDRGEGLMAKKSSKPQKYAIIRPKDDPNDAVDFLLMYRKGEWQGSTQLQSDETPEQALARWSMSHKGRLAQGLNTITPEYAAQSLFATELELTPGSAETLRLDLDITRFNNYGTRNWRLDWINVNQMIVDQLNAADLKVTDKRVKLMGMKIANKVLHLMRPLTPATPVEAKTEVK
jgi:hypothetical protein